MATLCATREEDEEEEQEQQQEQQEQKHEQEEEEQQEGEEGCARTALAWMTSHVSCASRTAMLRPASRPVSNAIVCRLPPEPGGWGVKPQ